MQDPSADAAGTGAAGPDEPEPEPEPESESEPEFGAQVPTRVAADVEYRGRSGEHDYLVRVRHRLLDTSATVVIDGVEHDPQAEEKALKKAEKAEKAEKAQHVARAKTDQKAEAIRPGEAAEADVDSDGEQPDADVDPDGEQPDAAGQVAGDGVRFRCEDGFTSLRIVVLRPGNDGEHEDAEVIRVRTVGLGGAGEVEVRRDLERVPLAPAEGSPSAAREEKRAAHPTRFALTAALAASARYLIPLLGLGALLSGLLDPVKEWVVERLRPLVEAVVGFIAPIWEWFSQLTRPVREFLGAVTRPVRELRDWVVELLFGWIPEFSLPFSVPGWVVDAAIPVLVVLFVFVVTLRQLRHRGAKLEEARKAPGAGGTPAEGTGGAEGADDDAEGDDAEDEAVGDARAPARGAEDRSSTAPSPPER